MALSLDTLVVSNIALDFGNTNDFGFLFVGLRLAALFENSVSVNIYFYLLDIIERSQGFDMNNC